jgi:phi LC3 family holin
MKINWTVRIKNPVFWANIALAIFLPILAQLGMSWEDVTTWAALGNLLLSAIRNPVIVVSVLVSVWNALNDPTTAGISDSAQAMTYTAPRSEREVE